ncbi:TPA: hypothetical protein DCZ46_02315 [Candidatus Campbellbacteria bacterium]|uniref:Uncharacterized protein n=1 Tax=Candidatus Nomurabacteria bacterium GW2011_GWC2_42_20 TaxID=1618756 RepID=A0A0G1BQ44_9BACT|nr:MAG: hypothetical protein UU88_C0003G0021 [Parcubacteria group bacterium GW2011_GWC1_42_11]KKS48356.1 MAG: hypothetical protein UV12_C0001G0051 [Candidatus Nomurabacteria bacterium GW2011_GWC2_42_20]KKS59024.1 MAG: hypothetical protein UV24_C0009G0015 [Candidatus Nomurabacteria bacterium GW2011_GWA2_42_41]KKT09932.1 MAG: hypothetical protein UV86_C0001G0034 [Candidatus Nomurabacteria bacterium GW2011_GWB1_43_20]TAN35570.1 MAG: hypothetical protein EPN27_03380 [Patescibacteria group bacterium
MELKKHQFSLAVSVTFGVVYVICAGFTALWPDFAMRLLGWMAHIVNVDKFVGGVEVTLAGVTIGLLEIVVYGYGTAYLFAYFYNRFTAPSV